MKNLSIRLAPFVLSPLVGACSAPDHSSGPQGLVAESKPEADVSEVRQAVLTIPIDEAFVWVQAGNPAPVPRWSYSSEDGSNSVSYLGTGRYRVDFGGMATDQGNAQAFAYGSTNARCKIEWWAMAASGNGVSVYVDCYRPNGTPVDSAFVASFVGGLADGPYAHLWTQYGDRDHTAPTYYSVNSAAQTNFVDRTGTGEYTVTLNGLNRFDGNVQVTAYGGGANYCSTSWWNQVADDTVVRVRCFDTSGALADSQFTLRYITNSFGFSGRSDVAYAWANDPAAASYTPNTGFAFNAISGQPAITATRTGVGAYSVKFPGMPLVATTALVTAYGGSNRHCHPKGWAGTETSATGPGITTTLDVVCFDPAGNAADSQFTAQYVHSMPTVNGFVSTGVNTLANRCATGTVDGQLDGLDSFTHTRVSYGVDEEMVIPPTGDGIAVPDNDPVDDHVQGIGRIPATNSDRLMVMTISNENQSGMLFVEVGAVNGNGGEAFNAGQTDDRVRNHTKAYFPLDTKHPGGLQVLGTSVVATIGPSMSTGEPLVFLFNPRNPAAHTFVSEARIQVVNLRRDVIYPSNVSPPPNGTDSAMVGLVRLATGVYLMAVTSSGHQVWLYLSDGSTLSATTKWFFHNTMANGVVHPNENANFVTQCDGRVHYLATSNPNTIWSQVLLGAENGVTNYVTSTHLYRQLDGKLTIAADSSVYGRGEFQNAGYCDFRSAANPYVTPSGKLVMYCAARGATEAKNYRFGEVPAVGP